MNNKENENSNLNEARSSESRGKPSSKKDSLDQHIRSRVSFVKNRLRLPLNASITSGAVKDYVSMSAKNPKLSHYEILQKLGRQKRDAVAAINNAVPIRMVVNAPESQLRRALRDMLKENKMELNESFNPPAMLLLKRQAIRMFPNGQRIALYTDNKYGLTFPVPYDESGAGFGAVSTMGSGPINAMKGYVNEETVPVVFASGEEIEVEQEVLNKIAEVYDSLNEENRQKLNDMILESHESFNKIKEFVSSIK